MTPITLIPSASRVGAEDIARLVPGEVCACDFYVTGAETGIEVPGGFQVGNILNIDHHSPSPRMARVISSANLAIAQVLQCGLPKGRIVINHTDCDSILSAGIAAGRLKPEQRFGDAAIAADHTGVENPIADLLQALDDRRDADLSFSNLERLLANQPLDNVAQAAVENRKRKRDAARKAVADGLVSASGNVAFGVLREAIDGEFLPPLCPDAWVIVLASRMNGTGRWQMKVRLGNAAPAGLTIPALGITSFDPDFGGRWNAGSNKRGGGTTIAPDDYAARIRSRVESLKQSIG